MIEWDDALKGLSSIPYLPNTCWLISQHWQHPISRITFWEALGVWVTWTRAMQLFMVDAQTALPFLTCQQNSDCAQRLEGLVLLGTNLSLKPQDESWLAYTSHCHFTPLWVTFKFGKGMQSWSNAMGRSICWKIIPYYFSKDRYVVICGTLGIVAAIFKPWEASLKGETKSPKVARREGGMHWVLDNFVKLLFWPILALTHLRIYC